MRRCSCLRFLTEPGAEPVQAAAWEAARYLELRGLVQKALTEAQSENLPLAQRVFAIRALQGGRFASVGSVLTPCSGFAKHHSFKDCCGRGLGRF